MKNKHKELIRQVGMNPLKPDSFQILNEPLMDNLKLWSNENIEIQDIFQSYFGVKVRTKIVAILLDLDLNTWIGVAGMWQHNSLSGQVRIDAKLTEFLLESAYGPSPANQPFNIKKINQLELEILQGFLTNIEAKMKNFWEVDPKHPYLMDTIYLVWLIYSEQGEAGRVAFGIPASFKPKAVEKEKVIESIDINKLANTGIKIPVDFSCGLTRLTVSEIKSLEYGDLILFEDSDATKFEWHFGEIGLVLPERDHPVFIHEVENIQELAKEVVRTTHNIDDDPLSSLPLELSAEFQKVLIPLKQVLELKSGGVLPLGPVLDSELILTAQGKPVARGELVIIGNQFGMRITELLIGSKKTSKGGSAVELEDLFGKGQQVKSDQGATFQEELKDIEEP